MASSSSSSMGGSLALAAATAMALSGSLVIFSLCRAAKPHGDASSSSPSSSSSEPALRPCLSSSEKRRRGGKARGEAEKRVRFAEDVVDNEGAPRPLPSGPTCRGAAEAERMPANREALYRGMLRDRSMHRVAYSC